MQVFALRLRPHQDLRQELIRFTEENTLQAGFILTCVGSLERAVMRYSGQHTPTITEGKFEIVSLVGTLCPTGVHLHLAISDDSGVTRGGHLTDGSRIHTTAEIVIGAMPGMEFRRELDSETGYTELRILTVSSSH